MMAFTAQCWGLASWSHDNGTVYESLHFVFPILSPIPVFELHHRFIYSLLDAVPPIHAESSHVATDKVPSM